MAKGKSSKRSGRRAKPENASASPPPSGVAASSPADASSSADASSPAAASPPAAEASGGGSAGPARPPAPLEAAPPPAGPSEEESGPSSHGRSWERLKIGGHVALQILLALVIFGQVNYLSCQRYQRWDLTQNRKFTLSDTTLGFLSQLDSEVTLVMAFLGSSELFDDVKSLISEYDRHGGRRVSAEILDLSRNHQRLAALRDEHGIEFARDAVAIISRDRRKILTAEELVTRDRASGRVLDFRGEEALTSALLEVTEQQQKTLYLVAGKRRGEEFRSIAGQLAELAAAQNARLEALTLEGAPAIPDDADAVILAGNSQPLSEREVELLSRYWHDPDEERRGALLILLDPAARDEALHAFLRTHGVSPRDDRVMSVASIPGMATRKIYEVAAGLLEGPGVAPELARLTLQLTGQTQSLGVEMDSDLLRAENIHPRPLMITAQNFWGETGYRDEEIAFSESQDHAWPVYTAASVERGFPGDPDMSRPASRLVVASNPDLIDPRGNTSKVSADFVMSALNWTINREQLGGISPRKPAAYVLAVDPARLSLLQNLIILLFPALALIAGGAVWLARRS